MPLPLHIYVPSVHLLPPEMHRLVRRLQADARDVAKECVEEGLANVKARARQMDLILTEEYIDSFDIVKGEDGWALTNKASFANVIEFGRRPGARPPPYHEILHWVLNKPRFRVRGKSMDGGFVRGYATTAAWWIRKKIAREGTEPKYILTRESRRMNSRFRRIWRERMNGRTSFRGAPPGMPFGKG